MPADLRRPVPAAARTAEARHDGEPWPEAKIVAGTRQDLVSRASRRFAARWTFNAVPMKNERPIVSFTFDDIPDTALTAGAGILAEEGVRGTFYVAGGLCGRRFDPWRFARAEQLSQLVEAGHEIGCHTFSHPDLQRLSRGAVLADLARNDRFLRDLGAGLKIESFAYPYGSVGLRQKRVVSARFASCRGVRPGINAGEADLAQLLAQRLYDAEFTPADVDGFIAETVRRNGWLVFYTHDVDPAPSDQGSSPDLLRHAVRTARRLGCETLTIAEAAKRVRGLE